MIGLRYTSCIINVKSNSFCHLMLWHIDPSLFYFYRKQKNKHVLQHYRQCFFLYRQTCNRPLRPRSQSRGTTFSLNINIWHILQARSYPWHPHSVHLLLPLQPPAWPSSILFLIHVICPSFPHHQRPPPWLWWPWMVVKTQNSPPSAMTQPAKALVSTTGQDNSV